MPVPQEVDTTAGAGCHAFTVPLLALIHDQDEVRRESHGGCELAATVSRDIQAAFSHDGLSLWIGGKAMQSSQPCGSDDHPVAQGLPKQSLPYGAATMVAVADHKDRRDIGRWLQVAAPQGNMVSIRGCDS